MPQSLYQASVPVYVKSFAALTGILDKAAAHAKAGKFDAEALLTARLFPDMWPLATQVQQVTSLVARGTARLAGLPIPNLPDKAANFDDLKARVAQTIDFLKSVDPAAVDAGEAKDITFPMGDRQATLTGRQYFDTFTLPNFYFHFTTVYNILRHNGVPLVKEDFTGEI
jgi:hypothetical protein